MASVGVAPKRWSKCEDQEEQKIQEDEDVKKERQREESCVDRSLSSCCRLRCIYRHGREKVQSTEEAISKLAREVVNDLEGQNQDQCPRWPQL